MGDDVAEQVSGVCVVSTGVGDVEAVCSFGHNLHIVGVAGAAVHADGIEQDVVVRALVNYIYPAGFVAEILVNSIGKDDDDGTAMGEFGLNFRVGVVGEPLDGLVYAVVKRRGLFHDLGAQRVELVAQRVGIVIGERYERGESAVIPAPDANESRHVGAGAAVHVEHVQQALCQVYRLADTPVALLGDTSPVNHHHYGDPGRFQGRRGRHLFFRYCDGKVVGAQLVEDVPGAGVYHRNVGVNVWRHGVGNRFAQNVHDWPRILGQTGDLPPDQDQQGAKDGQQRNGAFHCARLLVFLISPPGRLRR